MARKVSSVLREMQVMKIEANPQLDSRVAAERRVKELEAENARLTELLKRLDSTTVDHAADAQSWEQQCDMARELALVAERRVAELEAALRLAKEALEDVTAQVGLSLAHTATPQYQRDWVKAQVRAESKPAIAAIVATLGGQIE